MENFQPLEQVFREVSDLVDATAAFMDTVAARTLAAEGGTRNALLARTIASQRSALASALRDYTQGAPAKVKFTWLQYTAETDRRRLLEELYRARSLNDVLQTLDHIDEASSEMFEISLRQNQPDESKDACARAARRIERQRERRETAVRTAYDI